jgi:hypothetical protein
VLLKGTSPDPAARYPDMHALLSALQHALRKMHKPRRLTLALAAALTTVALFFALIWRAPLFTPRAPLARAPSFTPGAEPASAIDLHAAMAGADAKGAQSEESAPAAATGVRAERPSRQRALTNSANRLQQKRLGRKRYNDELKDPF